MIRDRLTVQIVKKNYFASAREMIFLVLLLNAAMLLIVPLNPRKKSQVDGYGIGTISA